MDKLQNAVIVNGKEVALPESKGLVDTLQSLGLDYRYVIVELNGEALLKDKIPSTTLSSGDRLEIVKPVAGG